MSMPAGVTGSGLLEHKAALFDISFRGGDVVLSALKLFQKTSLLLE